MLAIIDRPAKRGLTLLEQLRVKAMRDGGRFQAHHGAERELSRAERPLGHRHEPVGGEYLVISARPALLQGAEKGLPVKHQCPIAVFFHQHGKLQRRVFRLDAGAGSFMGQDLLDELRRTRTLVVLLARVVVLHARHVWHVLVLVFSLSLGLGLGRERGSDDQENGRKEYEGATTRKHERSIINEATKPLSPTLRHHEDDVKWSELLSAK